MLEGYVIVQKPFFIKEWYANQYESNPKLKEPLQLLRKSIPFTDPLYYRGISRFPLSRLYTNNLNEHLEWLASSNRQPEDNLLAKHKLAQFVEESDMGFKLSDNMDTFEQALEVFRLIDSEHQSKYEIIRIVRDVTSKESATLGFDIGYWGRDFSIICDCAIAPVWHPPALADLQELANQLQNLNAHLLFDSVEDANNFKEYYLSKSWAEGEGTQDEGLFQIIRIDQCDL